MELQILTKRIFSVVHCKFYLPEVFIIFHQEGEMLEVKGLENISVVQILDLYGNKISTTNSF